MRSCWCCLGSFAKSALRHGRRGDAACAMAARRLRGTPCSNDTTAFPLSGPWPGTRGYMLHLMDSGVAEFLRKLVWNHSLLDVGAGTGMYGAHFHSLRADPSRGSQKVDAPAWVGFDGSPDVENFTRTKGPPGSLTLQADLCDPSLTLPTLDWAMSLEVGEHLPTHCLANYLRLLDAGNRRGLFLSWAVPGQSGHCHINTRAPAVVVATLAVLGYDFAVNDTLRARSEANTNSVQEHAHGVPPRRPPLLRLTQAPAEPRRLTACLPMPPTWIGRRARPVPKHRATTSKGRCSPEGPSDSIHIQSARRWRGS